MGIIKVIKKIDTKNRITVPLEWGVKGEYVCFEITRAGNLVVKKVTEKVSNEEMEKETDLNEDSNL